jgi:hypothetical protein
MNPVKHSSIPRRGPVADMTGSCPATSETMPSSVVSPLAWKFVKAQEPVASASSPGVQSADPPKKRDW